MLMQMTGVCNIMLVIMLTTGCRLSFTDSHIMVGCMRRLDREYRSRTAALIPAVIALR